MLPDLENLPCRNYGSGAGFFSFYILKYFLGHIYSQSSCFSASSSEKKKKKVTFHRDLFLEHFYLFQIFNSNSFLSFLCSAQISCHAGTEFLLTMCHCPQSAPKLNKIKQITSALIQKNCEPCVYRKSSCLQKLHSKCYINVCLDFSLKQKKKNT